MIFLLQVNLFFFLHIFVMLRNKLFSRISVGGTAPASTYRKLFYSTLSLTLLLGIAHQQSLLHYLVIQLAGWTARGKLVWFYLNAIIIGVQVGGNRTRSLVGSFLNVGSFC